MARKLMALALLNTICIAAQAGEVGQSIRAVTPIFSQLVVFSFPRGFVPAFENVKASSYIQESVPAGESVNKWTQMITITGAKDLALSPNVSPLIFADSVAAGFKRVCPDSFSATSLGESKLGGYNAFSAVISCGSASSTKEQYSESLLLIVVEGVKDYYTIQWAERGDASELPLKFESAKWTGRFKKLLPIKLCSLLPGEAAPYPSC